MDILVFVYGTLKKGEPNHNFFSTVENGTAEFFASAVTVETYPLVIASKYNIPYLLDKEGTGCHIVGEIYHVDSQMLESLDKFEGSPDYYMRRQIPVRVMDKTNVKEKGNTFCWTYLLPNFKSVLLQLPFYSNYSSAGSHGLRYVESERTTKQDEIYDDDV